MKQMRSNQASNAVTIVINRLFEIYPWNLKSVEKGGGRRSKETKKETLEEDKHVVI